VSWAKRIRIGVRYCNRYTKNNTTPSFFGTKTIYGSHIQFTDTTNPLYIFV
jgi:hypothetical protein